MVIISCFDARIQPREFLQITNPFVLSNAGGRVDEGILRSLTVLDNVKGVRSVMVIHHTDCGLTHNTDAGLREKLKARNPGREVEIDQLSPFGEIKEFVISFLPFSSLSPLGYCEACLMSGADEWNSMDQSVREDVAAIHASPFLKHIEVKGFVFNIEHGTVSEVE